MKIWLDDIRNPPSNDYIWVKNVTDCLAQLVDCNVKNIPIELLSLDNDLGENELEGKRVVDWLEIGYLKNTFPMPLKVEIHSNNIVAKEYMEKILHKIYSHQKHKNKRRENDN